MILDYILYTRTLKYDYRWIYLPDDIISLEIKLLKKIYNEYDLNKNDKSKYSEKYPPCYFFTFKEKYYLIILKKTSFLDGFGRDIYSLQGLIIQNASFADAKKVVLYTSSNYTDKLDLFDEKMFKHCDNKNHAFRKKLNIEEFTKEERLPKALELNKTFGKVENPKQGIKLIRILIASSHNQLFFAVNPVTKIRPQSSINTIYLYTSTNRVYLPSKVPGQIDNDISIPTEETEKKNQTQEKDQKNHKIQEKINLKVDFVEEAQLYKTLRTLLQNKARYKIYFNAVIESNSKIIDKEFVEVSFNSEIELSKYLDELPVEYRIALFKLENRLIDNGWKPAINKKVNSRKTWNQVYLLDHEK